jgi:hypothetical protein
VQPSRAVARARAATLAGGPDAFVCSRCITLLDSSKTPPTPAEFATHARKAGVHSATVGTAEWRRDTYGVHKVCGLCTGIYLDALTHVRIAFAAPKPREHRLEAGGRKAARKSRPDGDRGHDVLDKPWLMNDGSFEGGKRR